MKSFYFRYKKEIDQVLIFLSSLLLALLFFKYALRIVAPFVLAIVLALIISPAVDFITAKLRLPRTVATVISMFVVLSALGLIVVFALRLLTAQLLSFVSGFPEAVEKATQIHQSFRHSYNRFFEIIPEDMRSLLDNTVYTAINSMAQWAAKAAKNLSFSAVKGVPKTFVFSLVTIISTFFMIKDKRKMSAFVIKRLPSSVKTTAEILKKDIFGALWGYVKAQMILMCFSGIIAIIGLTLMGYEYSLLIGLCIAFFDALPIFGPGFVLWPWAAVSILSGSYGYAIGLMVIYLIIIFNRQMLEPKVLSSQIGLHPLVTLIALYSGLMLLGAVGLIAGPLLAIIIRSLQSAGLLPGVREL